MNNDDAPDTEPSSQSSVARNSTVVWTIDGTEVEVDGTLQEIAFFQDMQKEAKKRGLSHTFYFSATVPGGVQRFQVLASHIDLQFTHAREIQQKYAMRHGVN